MRVSRRLFSFGLFVDPQSAKHSSIYNKRERCLQNSYVYADRNHYVVGNTTHVIPVPVKAVQAKDQCLPNQRLFLKALKQIVNTDGADNVSRREKSTDAAKVRFVFRNTNYVTYQTV